MHLTLRYSPLTLQLQRRGSQTLIALCGVAGALFVADGDVDLGRVNEYQNKQRDATSLPVLVDLPNYRWNHSKYWHESPGSKDWRLRPFVRHDLLGTKALGTSWQSPVWRNKLRLENNPWPGDHKLGDKVVFPVAGYICMAIEAMYQVAYTTTWMGAAPKSCSYRMRDIKFFRALVLNSSEEPPVVMLTLMPVPSSTGAWFEFKISAMKLDVWNDLASGYIRVETALQAGKALETILSPFGDPVSPDLWYKRMRDGGLNFGPAFQKIMAMEYTIGQRTGRSTISLEPPTSIWVQSYYPIHPASIGGCFQTVISSMWAGDSNSIDVALVPLRIDSLVVPSGPPLPKEAVSVSRSDYVGVGRRELAKNHSSSCSVSQISSDGDNHTTSQRTSKQSKDISKCRALSSSWPSLCYPRLLWIIHLTLL